MRGATGLRFPHDNVHFDFNPHSPCGERRHHHPSAVSASDFNPHSPCGERQQTLYHCFFHGIFQSTLPMRGATFSNGKRSVSFRNFNPHSPCGERRLCHAPFLGDHRFQSTLPMRGATAKVTEFTLNLKTKFMTFGTKTNCETLQSSVSRICSNEKNYISQVRISKQFMIASHSHIYKISGSSGIYDALFPKCSTFF